MSDTLGEPRDQAVSTISAILMRLCDSSGATAAALVDGSGETVDYAGRLSPFDARIAAAELRLVLHLLEASKAASFRGAHQLSIRAKERSFVAVALSEGYAIVLVLPRRAWSVSPRALAEAGQELELETSLFPLFRHDTASWSRVEVKTSGRKGRPEAVWHEGGWRQLTILGRFQSRDLAHREVGYLTRLPSGSELLLVREPLNRWFAGRPR